jgi:hypothetical protein
MFMERDPAIRPAPSLAAEHDWAAASSLIRPALRPVGTVGVDGTDVRVSTVSSAPGKPLVKPGPAGVAVGFVIPGRGFDVHVGVDHMLAWGVGPDAVEAAAMANLAAWSLEAEWVDEVNGQRRVRWSDSGDGMDAARILLRDVRRRLAADLAPAERVLVGVPERNLLIAAALSEGDDEFAAMLADYVAGRAHAADDPIDGRLFELVDGELVEFNAESGR